MSMITYDRIRIEGAFELQKILKMQISVLANTHAIATIEGVYKNIEELLRWQISGEMQEVKIWIEGENSPLFCGILKETECNCEAGYYTVKLAVVSFTILLDREKVSASYQDVAMTYEEVAKAVINSSEKASCICTAGSDVKIQKPLIQYAETDWMFLKRLASHVQTVLYPAENQSYPALWLGKPEGRQTELIAKEYRHGVNSRFYELGGKQSGFQPKDFEYYIVETSENLAIGTEVICNGALWYVWEKRAELRKSELKFTYTLGKAQFMIQQKSFHPAFAGMSILGKVLSTGGETVKLHLDIDKTQDEKTAYPYVYAPDTGSVMYCMPKVGTTVSLYFSNEDETSARAINCIRENGSICNAMSNPNNRALNTEHGKQMFLNTDSMGFDIEDKGHAIHMEDEIGIDFFSGKKVSIVAGAGLKLKGKKVSLETTQQMSMVRK